MANKKIYKGANPKNTMFQKSISLFAILFLFTLVMASSVSAVKPVDQTFSGTNGLQIEFPSFSYGKVNTSVEMPFHVYNLQDGRAVTSGVSCTLHIYEMDGHHIYIDTVTTTEHTYDYEFEINDSTFTYTGEYRFVNTCECVGCGVDNEDLGGFVTHNFEITSDGLPDDTEEGSGILIVLIIIPIIIALLLILGSAFLGEQHSILRWVSYFMVLPFSWVSFHFGTIALVKYFDMVEFQIAIGSTVYWSGWVFFALIFYLIIYLVYTAFQVAAQKKKAKLEY